MILLIEFLYRLAFGLSVGMAVTSPRQVTSGFFRVHLYVVLGLNTLAAMVALADQRFAAWPAIAGAVFSYAGAVCWLYEAARPGRVLLVLVAVLALLGAGQAMPVIASEAPVAKALWRLDPPSSGLVLGLPMAAMLLGHWYLNNPGMKLAPLRRLVTLLAVSVGVRMVLCGVSLALLIAADGMPAVSGMLFIGLRWLSGFLGALLLAWMTWQTLKIPNTQSATGILYVAVIVTFIGELSSQLLSVEAGLPL